MVTSLVIPLNRYYGIPHDYQLKLIPLVAPPAPLAPLAPPKKTGSSFFPVSVAAHAPSNNDAARSKTAAGEAIPIADKSDIFSVVDILNYLAKSLLIN
jgi:hypothetical protein